MHFKTKLFLCLLFFSFKIYCKDIFCLQDHFECVHKKCNCCDNVVDLNKKVPIKELNENKYGFFLKCLVRFANSGVISDKSGILNSPYDFDSSFFYNLCQISVLKNIIKPDKNISFVSLVDGCINKQNFHVLQKVLFETLNLRVINRPISTIKFSRVNSTACFLVLKEADAGRIFKETAILINGVNSSLRTALTSAEKVCQLCNFNVLLVYNASSGSTLQELLRGILDAKGYVNSSLNSTIANIKKALKFVYVLNNEEPFIVFAHSDGTSLFNAAMRELNWKYGEEFCYFSAGPASILRSRNFLAAFQVASKRDPIPFITNTKFSYESYNISTVPPSAVSPIFDHGFSSPTYFRQVEKFVDEFRGMSYDY